MENEFDALLLQKRHLEIIETLKLISENLTKEEQDSGVLEAILAQGEKLKTLVNLISQIPAPEVTVDVNLDELKTAFQNIKEEIIQSNTKVIETIENRLLPFSFDLNRESNGLTTSVKVNYKKATEIN
jgi:hypothetical protein